MNSSSGYSINRWTDGKTTVVKFSAVGALAGLVLQGVVVDHVANGSKLFQTTESRWRSVREVRHPDSCCRGGPLMEPPAPRVRIDGKQAVVAAK